MKSQFKTPEGAAFSELFERLGKKKSEVAKALHLSRSAITMILKGDRNPRPATLAGLRLLVDHQEQFLQQAPESGIFVSDDPDFDKNLRVLKETKPSAYASVRQLTADLVGGVSSKIASVAQSTQAAASAAARNQHQGSKRSPKAVAPSENKRGQGPDADKSSEHKPGAPGQARE